MKHLTIRFNGKKYHIRPEGVAVIAVALVLIIALIVALVVKASKKEEPEETPEETAETEEVYDSSAGVLDKKKYDGTVLEETEDAGIDYVTGTLFLGDSNTARFLREINPETNKTYASKENAIGVVGMGIDAISSLACMDFSTGRVTMPQAVKILQPERVIITFGTNNLYGSSTDATSFIERYTAGIRSIEKAYPSVDIIINSIPPVSKNTTYTNVKMVQIDAYNEAIAKMCKDNNWKYLNSAEALKDEKTGYARDGYMVSADGLHLSNKGLEALFKYIRTHSYITEDDRPKPLTAIPTIIGVPDGLIRTDPLTNEEYTEDPLTLTDASTPTPEATATPTPTLEETSTSEPATDPSQTACVGYGGTWSNGTCACPASAPIWNAQSSTCNGCPTGQTYDVTTGTCITPVQTEQQVEPETTVTEEINQEETTEETVVETPVDPISEEPEQEEVQEVISGSDTQEGQTAEPSEEGIGGDSEPQSESE